MKIVVLDGYLLGFGGRSWEPIARHGEFAYHDMTTAQDDVAAVIGNADAVYTNRCPVSAETIGRCPNLKMICSFGTGYNQIWTPPTAAELSSATFLPTGAVR